MIELEGKLLFQPVSILVNPSASLSYVSPKIEEICKLKSHIFIIPWLVQLAMGEKSKVCAQILNYALEINEHQLTMDLNILHMGYYYVLLGMD